jgi:hypothetical protein
MLKEKEKISNCILIAFRTISSRIMSSMSSIITSQQSTAVKNLADFRKKSCISEFAFRRRMQAPFAVTSATADAAHQLYMREQHRHEKRVKRLAQRSLARKARREASRDFELVEIDPDLDARIAVKAVKLENQYRRAPLLLNKAKRAEEKAILRREQCEN